MATIRFHGIDVIFRAMATEDASVRISFTHPTLDLRFAAILSPDDARTIAETLGAAVARAEQRKDSTIST